MSVGLMINERELINDRMIHSRAHCPSKFSGGSRLLSAGAGSHCCCRAAQDETLENLPGAEKRKGKREEKGREALSGLGQWRFRYTILETARQDPSLARFSPLRMTIEPVMPRSDFVFRPTNLPSSCLTLTEMLRLIVFNVVPHDRYGICKSNKPNLPKDHQQIRGTSAVR